MAVLEELEETARLWLDCAPRPAPLVAAQIDELRRHVRRALVADPRRRPRCRASPPTCRMMYHELPFLDRFAAAARDGFDGGRVPVPLRMAGRRARRAAAEHGLQQVLFNAPPGDCDERRARHRQPARPRGGVPERLRARARLRRGARLPAHPRDGRPRAGGRDARGACAATYLENLRGPRREAARRRRRRADRADQHARHPGLLPQPAGRGARGRRRGRRAATSRCRWTCTTARSSRATSR